MPKTQATPWARRESTRARGPVFLPASPGGAGLASAGSGVGRATMAWAARTLRAERREMGSVMGTSCPRLLVGPSLFIGGPGAALDAQFAGKAIRETESPYLRSGS